MTGCQTLINAALRKALSATKEKKDEPLTGTALGHVLREESRAS